MTTAGGLPKSPAPPRVPRNTKNSSGPRQGRGAPAKSAQGPAGWLKPLHSAGGALGHFVQDLVRPPLSRVNPWRGTVAGAQVSAQPLRAEGVRWLNQRIRSDGHFCALPL
jgi:hypothetical protein